MHVFLDYIYRILPNIEYFLAIVCIFLAAAFSAGLIGFMLVRQDVVAARLSRLLSPKGALPAARPRLLEEEKKGLLATTAEALHTYAEDDDPEKRSALRLKLVQAGLRSRQAYRNFLALRIALAVVLPAGYLLTSSFYGLTANSLLKALALTAVGLYLPGLVLSSLVARRKRGLTRTLPDALDLMVICVEAGLGLDMTFKRVGEEIRPMSRDLSDEFHLANLEIAAGKSREDSFRNMARRTGVPEIKNLLNILTQASRFGTSVANALKTHTEDMRIKRRLNAEEKAAKMGVLLLLPLLGFIFPALMVVLLGPAGIKIARILLPALSGGG